MLETLFLGIKKILEKEFPGFPVNWEKKEVIGLETPAFFMSLRDFNEKPLIADRHHQKLTIDVQYFPENSEDYEELYDVNAKLFSSVEWVMLEDENEDFYTQARNKRFEIIDGVLIFSADFNFIMAYSNRQQTHEITDNMEVMQLRL